MKKREVAKYFVDGDKFLNEIKKVGISAKDMSYAIGRTHSYISNIAYTGTITRATAQQLFILYKIDPNTYVIDDPETKTEDPKPEGEIDVHQQLSEITALLRQIYELLR